MTEQTRTVDVLVVGGGTTGLYFGGLMAARGFEVVICEQKPAKRFGEGFDIIHIARDEFVAAGLHVPEPGDPDYVSHFSLSIQRSALNNHPKRGYCETLVLRRSPIIERLRTWAREQGAEILTGADFSEPLYDAQGRLIGGVFTLDNSPENSPGNSPDNSPGNGPVGLDGLSDSDDPVDLNVTSVLSDSGDPCDPGGPSGSDPLNSLATLNIIARLTADASGIPAVVRTALPDDYGVETFETTPRDQFYVILHYADLCDPTFDHVEVTTTWTHYKIWLAPQHGSSGAIMGVGANLSFDYAEMVYQRFLKKGYLPKHTLNHIEQGSTPYRRPPYSFVADNFVVLGSAACISNPWSGEGVPYSWLQCRIAAEVAAAAMGDGDDSDKGSSSSSADSSSANSSGADSHDTNSSSASHNFLSQAELWGINPRYYRAQGALFAKNLAMLSGATDCTEAENDYEYAKGIIYEDHDEQGNSLERGNLVVKLLVGLVSGHISLSTLRKLLAASGIGEKIERHYLAYPASPEGLPDWIATAEELWKQAGSMAEAAEADLARS
jgi:flavin-dependent dehydrogenase